MDIGCVMSYALLISDSVISKISKVTSESYFYLKSRSWESILRVIAVSGLGSRLLTVGPLKHTQLIRLKAFPTPCQET